jgi:hypothetical protein
LLKEIKESLLHLVFPHECKCRATDNLQAGNLPVTDFYYACEQFDRKDLWGKNSCLLCKITMLLYKRIFDALPHALIQVQANKELGIYLGKLVGWAMAKSNCF